MATIVSSRAAAPSSWAEAFPVRLALLVLLGLLVAGLHPYGYTGGGADDGRYLEAVRCIVSNGYCVPTNHWAARLPVVLPSSAIVALVGESRGTLLLIPLLYGAGSLILFALLVRRIAGERAATLASLALICTPAFISRWLRLNVDIPELFFLLAALSLLLAAVRREQASLAIAAGAAVGLAVLSRTTAFTAAPIIVAGLMLFTSKPLKWTLLLAIGGLAALAAEALLHGLTAGRPLLSWELAHAHTRIPSTSLPRSLDFTKSPILNVDYIAIYPRPAGIRIHWLVDGALNLLANPQLALTLCAAIALSLASLVEARRKRAEAAPSRLPWFLVGAALLYFATLTFFFAVNPTPRMFMPVICVAAFAIGCWAQSHRSRPERLAIAAILAAMLATTATGGLRTVHLPDHEEEAERWVAESREPLAISRTAASVFALSPSLSELPRATPTTSRPTIGIGPGCTGIPAERLLRRVVPRSNWLIPHDVARRIGLQRQPIVLCLISPAGPAAAPRP